VVMPVQFDLCLSATRKLKALFNTFSPDVDIFSLDEAFIEYGPLRKLYASPQEFGAIIQKQIKVVLGEWVGCNVGISYNRLLAKLAGEVSAKGSVTVIDEKNRDVVLASTAFSDICGVGYRLEKRLRRLRVIHPYQLNFIEDEVLSSFFGPFWSKELRKIGQGEEPLFLTRINRLPHMKSVGRSITGYQLCDDETMIQHILLNLSEEVIYKVRKMGLAGRHVGIALSGNGQTWHAHRTLKHHLRHVREFFDLIYHQLYLGWQRHFPVIKFAVTLSQLRPWPLVQPVWFPEWQQQEKVAQAVDKLTEKYGLFTVTSGLHLGQQLIRPEVTGFLGDQQFQLGK
jgi:DNA polymerase IV